jgi:hypothetical protein
MPASAYATKVAEAFSSRLLKHIYEYAPIESFVNRDYEGEINSVGSVLNMLQFSKLAEKTYNGTNLSPDSLFETNTKLTIDQYKSFYWTEKTLDRWISYIKDPHSTVVEQKGNERIKNIMTYLFTFWADAASGQWYGTNYATGTVAVDVAGVVTGSGTTFTSAMVGKPFKATGHSVWYRVKTFSSTTSITIEDDSDDLTSAYSGGVISASATYVIQANTVLQIDNAGSNPSFLTMALNLKQMLDEAEVPDENRCLFVPPAGFTTMLKDAGIKLNVPAAYEDLVKQGFITELAGFKVFRSNRLAGDNTNGYHVMAVQKNFLTFADKPLEAGMEEDLIGNFGSAYKDLFVYGAKVADGRRKFAAQAFVKFA